MTPVAEKIERTNARIGSKAIAHQAVEPVKAFAHIAAFYEQENLQAPAEADHDLNPSRPINSAARLASRTLLIWHEAPPAKQIRNEPSAFLVVALRSRTASTHRPLSLLHEAKLVLGALSKAGCSCPRRCRLWIQLARVEYLTAM